MQKHKTRTQTTTHHESHPSLPEPFGKITPSFGPGTPVASPPTPRVRRAPAVWLLHLHSNHHDMVSNKSNDDMDVSKNSGTSKSSILIRFSIIHNPFWGTSIFGNTHMICLLLFDDVSHVKIHVTFQTYQPNRAA